MKVIIRDKAKIFQRQKKTSSIDLTIENPLLIEFRSLIVLVIYPKLDSNNNEKKKKIKIKDEKK